MEIWWFIQQLPYPQEAMGSELHVHTVVVDECHPFARLPFWGFGGWCHRSKTGFKRRKVGFWWENHGKMDAYDWKTNENIGKWRVLSDFFLAIWSGTSAAILSYGSFSNHTIQNTVCFARWVYPRVFDRFVVAWRIAVTGLHFLVGRFVQATIKANILGIMLSIRRRIFRSTQFLPRPTMIIAFQEFSQVRKQFSW